MPTYTETQRPRQTWFFLIIALLALFGWGLFIQQIVRRKPVGDNPMSDVGATIVAALLGLALPAFFLWFKLETTIYPDRVEIRMAPLTRRVIRASEIAGAEARTYRPLREFGGWGIRGWGANKAYNMSGDQGVQLVLTNGNRILIGTQHPQELEAAITSILQQ